MTARLLLLCVGAIAVALTTACGDPLRAKATLDNADLDAAVFGLTEAPVNGPSAVNTFVPGVVRTDPSQNYDVVFDIRPDSQGTPTAYMLPPRAVGLFGGAGIIKDTTHAFDEITQAPVRGYDDSTAVPIKAGDVLLVQAASFACASQLISDRQVIYSKFVIDSVNYSSYDPDTNPGGSTIHFHMRVDRNCGFISFADGLPTF
ncbi:MAG TPA: hypothetical protein VF041_18270 [Gemmatimonadaceae bacterium]